MPADKCVSPPVGTLQSRAKATKQTAKKKASRLLCTTAPEAALPIGRGVEGKEKKRKERALLYVPAQLPSPSPARFSRPRQNAQISRSYTCCFSLGACPRLPIRCAILRALQSQHAGIRDNPSVVLYCSLPSEFYKTYVSLKLLLLALASSHFELASWKKTKNKANDYR